MPRGEGEGDDTLTWKLTKTEVFDVRSYYKLLSGPLTEVFPWECIWCAKVPKRVSFFLWTAARDGMLTIDNLVKRGQSLVNSCCLCCCNVCRSSSTPLQFFSCIMECNFQGIRDSLGNVEDN